MLEIHVNNKKMKMVDVDLPLLLILLCGDVETNPGPLAPLARGPNLEKVSPKPPKKKRERGPNTPNLEKVSQKNPKKEKGRGSQSGKGQCKTPKNNK